jgi:chromosome segregation ATPase
VANLEERVASLEAQTDKHAVAVEALRTDIANLRVELRTEFAAFRGDMALRSETAELHRELAATRAEMATRTDVGELQRGLAATRAEMATRTDVGDLRREMGDLRNDMTRRADLLDAKVDRNFVWLMGMMVTGFITVIGALVGVVYR